MLVLLTVLLLELTGPAGAEAPFAAASCDIRDLDTGVVSEVLGPDTLALDDGSAVRFAGIAVIPGREDETTTLLTALVGRQIVLRANSEHLDRYGRRVAHVSVIDGPWLNAWLLAEGLAFVAGSAGDRACLAELMQAERSAREARAGAWSDLQIPSVWSDPIRTNYGRYALVEGEVVSLGRTERTVYLNFGRDWSQDFTVTINTTDAHIIENEGGPLDALVGRTVRIRGWLTEWDGPTIRVDHPEQIELLDD